MKQKDKVAEMKEQLMRELSGKHADNFESRQLHGIYHPTQSTQSAVKYLLRKSNVSQLSPEPHLSREALSKYNSELPLIESRQ